MAPNSPIGTRIRRAMERKRMDQAQLADKLGVSRSAVNAWINDRAYPQNSVGALEEVLEISLDDRAEAEPVSDALRAQIHRELGPEAARRVIGVLEGTLRVLPADGPGERQAPQRETG